MIFPIGIQQFAELRTKVEYRTSYGRIDLLIATNEYVYIIELKIDGSAEEALAQSTVRNILFHLQPMAAKL
jgi:Holliday junction resolvase-like predicted endonuclease